MRGQFPQKTFDTILCSSDVVILPYERSGQSGILAHCYAFTKPVVVSDIIPLRESIKRSKGGIVADSDQDYMKNILQIIGDDVLSNKLKNNIKEYVARDVGWDNVAQKHIKVYHSVVNVPYGKAQHVFWE